MFIAKLSPRTFAIIDRIIHGDPELEQNPQLVALTEKFLMDDPYGHRHMPAGRLMQSPYFGTGNPETEEMTTLYAPGMLGCVADFDQGGLAGPVNLCRYQLVKQAAAITGVVGQVFFWSNKGLITVNIDRTFRGHLAGIGRIAATTAASFIWILKKGDRTVLFQGSPTAAPSTAGLPVVPSASTDGVADALALATAPNVGLIGNTAGAAAANLALTRVNIPDTY